MTRTREQLAPLAALVGVVVLAACLCTLAVASVVLHADGRLDLPVWQVLVAGAPMAVLIAVAAAWVAARFARTLRLLRGEALRRLHDPSAPVEGGAGTSIPEWAGAEMVELARTLDALHLRVRMADEVAERHRRAAETASAGMFELLAGLVEAEEGARGQLSAELHDTVAQSLMAARSLLSEPISDVESVTELIAEAEDQVRAVMARTRPPALREGDLARAVGALRDDMDNRYGLHVDVSWPQQPYPLPLVTAVTVYRFFQEGLLNVVKHADADQARAELRIDEEWVVGVVADDGPGFDPNEVRAEQGRHVGLGLLRERARLVGGSLEVASDPAAGTTLTLRLPRGAAGATGLLPLARSSVA
ncbi:MAG TPA: ATP-binding protein [Mycobacteriales bacterium]|nr:ATP-binding protein [Mycobacteriales bacterium]